MKIYHNARCGKSRKALTYLKDRGVEPEIIEYLKEPITEKDLTGLLNMLGINAEQLVRKNEAVYKEQFKNREMSEKDWIDAMITHPKLMQRPILVKGKKAFVARDEATLESLF